MSYPPPCCCRVAGGTPDGAVGGEAAQERGRRVRVISREMKSGGTYAGLRWAGKMDQASRPGAAAGFFGVWTLTRTREFGSSLPRSSMATLAPVATHPSTTAITSPVQRPCEEASWLMLATRTPSSTKPRCVLGPCPSATLRAAGGELQAPGGVIPRPTGGGEEWWAPAAVLGGEPCDAGLSTSCLSYSLLSLCSRSASAPSSGPPAIAAALP
mmetsp:Transcript_3031/g.7290  ORF Transcript_3031/g.7290 Transcript_3031/m.7290 type:complete len:213 (+) Transcript_3031:433-1071(+)